MSAKKQKDTAVPHSAAYEQNEIQLKGIFGFAIGLFLLIVVTFGLMWALLGVLKDYSRENAGPPNPLAMTDKERLPAEPRLQSAPGFGVESETGRVNLELREPQAEYRELHKQWEHMWEHGQTQPGASSPAILPIAEAKARFLSQNVKAKSGADAEKVFSQSQMQVSDSSSGRIASEKRR